MCINWEWKYDKTVYGWTLHTPPTKLCYDSAIDNDFKSIELHSKVIISNRLKTISLKFTTRKEGGENTQFTYIFSWEGEKWKWKSWLIPLDLCCKHKLCFWFSKMFFFNFMLECFPFNRIWMTSSPFNYIDIFHQQFSGYKTSHFIAALDELTIWWWGSPVPIIPIPKI